MIKIDYYQFIAEYFNKFKIKMIIIIGKINYILNCDYNYKKDKINL